MNISVSSLFDFFQKNNSNENKTLIFEALICSPIFLHPNFNENNYLFLKSPYKNSLEIKLFLEKNNLFKKNLNFLFASYHEEFFDFINKEEIWSNLFVKKIYSFESPIEFQFNNIPSNSNMQNKKINNNNLILGSSGSGKSSLNIFSVSRLLLNKDINIYFLYEKFLILLKKIEFEKSLEFKKVKKKTKI